MFYTILEYNFLCVSLTLILLVVYLGFITKTLRCDCHVDFLSKNIEVLLTIYLLVTVKTVTQGTDFSARAVFCHTSDFFE